MLNLNRLHRLMPLAALLAMGHLDTLYGQFTVNPSSLTYNALLNGSLPATQSFTVTTGGSFSISTEYIGTTGWLTVTPNNGNSNGTNQISVAVNSTSLAPGTYQAAVRVTGSVPSVSVAVTYTVSPAVTLTSNPSALTFNYQIGTQAPPSKEITINAGGATVPINVTVNPGCTQATWLVATPTSLNTGQSITISVTNLSQLQLGPCTGFVTVSSPNSSTSLTIPVTINVGNNPVISLSTEQANFFFQTGGTVPPPVVVNFTSSGSPVVYFAAATNVPWLIISPTNSTTDNPLTISVSPLSLQPGVYTATVTLGFTGASNAATAIPVTLTVSTQALINAAPATLSFSYQPGTPAPALKQISVTSSGTPTNYTVTGSTTSGGNWMTISPSTGTTTGTINVGIDTIIASGLATGTYNGTVTINAPGAANSPRTVPVTLSINNLPILTPLPSEMSFGYQIGKANPAAQILRLTSSGAPFTFTAIPEEAPWLSVTPQGGTTGSADVIVTANPGTLAQGQYQGRIRVTAEGAGNSPLLIPVTFTVSNTPLIIVSPAAVEFTASVGSSTIQQTSSSVTSTDVNVPITFVAAASANTGGGWLAVTPSSAATPTNVTVLALPGGLPVGTYTGQVSIAAGGLLNSPQKILATLRITPTGTLAAEPATLSFTQAGASTPASQTIQITASPAGAVPFSATASTTTGGSWLSITPSGSLTTPSTITVSVNQNQLTPGTYNGSITIASSQVSNSPVTIPVTLTVGGTLNVNPSSLTFSWQPGAVAPTPQTIAVSLGSGIGSVQASTNASWLLVNPPSGTLPRDLTVSISTGGLTPGTYNGIVTLNSQAASVQVPVTLVVGTPGSACSSDKTALEFVHVSGGAAAPSQSLQFTCTGANTFTTSISPNTEWLSISPTSGGAPQTITLTANGAGLGAGTYTGWVRLHGAGVGIVQVNVTFIVRPAGSALCSASPSTLAFEQVAGSPAGTSKTVNLTCTGSSTYTSEIITNSPWLTVTPADGTTPRTIAFTTNATNLVPGTYTAVVTFRGANAPAVDVGVTLTVTAPPLTPVISAIVNAASQQAIDVAPGMLVTIYGQDLGPVTPAGLTIVNNRITTTAGNTRVFFDDVAAPILYASRNQINTIVPYGVGNRATTRVQVESSGVRTSAAEIRVSLSGPGLFTVTATGTGPAAVLNQDYSLNGVANPAPRGTVLQFFATGEGLTTPAGTDGLIIGDVLAEPNLAVTATIGGVTQVVEYAGSAPTLVSGVFQVNVRIAPNTPPGAQPVIIRVGNATSQPGVTAQIQ